jgi:hypothetical protein
MPLISGHIGALNMGYLIFWAGFQAVVRSPHVQKFLHVSICLSRESSATNRLSRLFSFSSCLLFETVQLGHAHAGGPWRYR